MTAKRRGKPNTLQMICSAVMLFCFSVYGICMIALDDKTPWKIACCILGILYAGTIQVFHREGKV